MKDLLHIERKIIIFHDICELKNSFVQSFVRFVQFVQFSYSHYTVESSYPPNPQPNLT
jgi:hypothetical protein